MIIRGFALLLGLLLVSSCGPTLTPVLDVQSSADAKRPADDAESCTRTDKLGGVVSDQVVYIVHAVPEPIGSSLGDLEVSVATGCTEVTVTRRHDQQGLALIPIALPEGAECGAIITASIAQATDRCVLDGAKGSGDGCVVECRTDSDSTDETTG
jgi:hypothetical protein